MKRTQSLLALVLTLTVALAACGPEALTMPTPMTVPSETPAEKPAAPAMTPSAAPTASPTADEGSRSVDTGATTIERQLAAGAIADLVARLGVTPEAITVIEVAEVDWPDAGLGCPAPGMAYAQMITNGMRVVLEAGDQTYNYHGRQPEDLFLCGPDGPVPAGQLPSAAPPVEKRSFNRDLDKELIVRVLMADMAKRLVIDQGTIEVLVAEAVEWRNSGLGCERSGEMTLQVITPGYRVVLAAGGTVFEYHTGTGGQFTLCEETTR